MQLVAAWGVPASERRRREWWLACENMCLWERGVAVTGGCELWDGSSRGFIHWWETSRDRRGDSAGVELLVDLVKECSSVQI
jgi:hypothetical protein